MSRNQAAARAPGTIRKQVGEGCGYLPLDQGGRWGQAAPCYPGDQANPAVGTATLEREQLAQMGPRLPLKEVHSSRAGQFW